MSCRCRLSAGGLSARVERATPSAPREAANSVLHAPPTRPRGGAARSPEAALHAPPSRRTARCTLPLRGVPPLAAHSALHGVVTKVAIS